LCGTAKAFEILTTGRWVEAEEAERIGIVNKVVPHSDLRSYTYDLARQYAKLPPLSIGHMKFLMYENLHTSLETGLALEHYAMGIAARSEDSKEGIKAWLEKREPTFQGK
jgi:enoyl-CoA hydratase/carnithine racemase